MTDLVETWVVLLACLGYGLAAWLVQAWRVVPPRDWLRERLWTIEDEITSGRWSNGGGARKVEALQKVENGLSEPWFLVPLSRVQAGWRYVHGLEDAHVLSLSPEIVDEQLKTAAVRLKAIRGAESDDLRKRIAKMARAADPPQHQKEKAALLQAAQVFRHNYNDTRYENLANLLGKAVWLTSLALALTVALSALFDRETYFLLGGAGALISRLTRVLRRRPSASDYGAEWSTLILSPAAGAVSAWLGVAIIVALANDPFNVLTDDFAELWDDAAAPLGLALAFLFGFSERLFDRLLARWENEVTGKFPRESDKNDNGDNTD